MPGQASKICFTLMFVFTFHTNFIAIAVYSQKMVVFFHRLVSDEVGGLSFRGIALEGSCKGSSEGTEVGDKWTVEMSNGGGGRRADERVGRVWRGERGRENSGLSKEPYTCERLSSIDGGYSELSRVHRALSLDFSDPEVMSDLTYQLPFFR